MFGEAGAVGLLGFAADERFGGVGARDFRYNQILIEAFMDADCGAVGLSFAVHNDICLPYLAELTTPEQQERWLPGFVKGDLIAAIGMTEPGAGSDVAGIRTVCRRRGRPLRGQRRQNLHHQRAERRSGHHAPCAPLPTGTAA